MGESCWIASLAIQQLFPIQILLPFPIFKLPPNFISQCYRPQTWQFYLFFPALSVSSIREVLGPRVGHMTLCCRRPIAKCNQMSPSACGMS